MDNEIKAVWIPFMVFSHILTGKSESSFTMEIKRRFERIAAAGLNRVFVHIRPFGDALYRSGIFPSSFLITGREGEAMPFDPLEIMVGAAHELGLKIEAWINPFRVRSPAIPAPRPCSDNPALKLLKSHGAIEYRGGLTYNPASSEACELIIEGVREVCGNYPVDGIHFDDYFYPTTDPYFDMESFFGYKAPGGGLSQVFWRRKNISMFLRDCYSTVHESGCGSFGISPKGFMDCNLNEEFLDVPEILSKKGYVDYVCPQAYFARTDEVCSFSSVMEDFSRLISDESGIRLIAGLAAYKIGATDRHAGKGSVEWLEGRNILSSMAAEAGRVKHYAGYALYNYQAAFEPEEHLITRMEAEMTALREMD